MTSLQKLRAQLKRAGNKHKARFLRGFFKTGPGEYAAGDKFLGVTVPQSRAIARKYRDHLKFAQVQALLLSKFHEERLVALLILVEKFKASARSEQKRIYEFYLCSTKHINNWDLVDLSACKIVGEYLAVEPRVESALLRLARSRNLWERRIAVLGTFAAIKRGHFAPALRIAKLLLRDKHDLIHKAVGWMLREIGKRSAIAEQKFLKKYYRSMPRTMLRYAIERFPLKKRAAYLEK